MASSHGGLQGTSRRLVVVHSECLTKSTQLELDKEVGDGASRQTHVKDGLALRLLSVESGDFASLPPPMRICNDKHVELSSAWIDHLTAN